MESSPEFYRQLHALVFTSTFGVIALNSLFLYLVIRNRVFVHYFLMVFGLTLHTSLVFFETYDLWLADHSSVVTAMITVLGSLLFTRSFIGFDTAKARFWDKYYDGLAALVVLIIVIQTVNLLIIEGDSVSKILSLFAAFFALVANVSGIILSLLWWKRKQTARLYFLINIPMLLAGLVYILVWYSQEQGIIEGIGILRFYISGGMAIQMILFSVFIGWKIKNFQREKLILEQSVNLRLKSEVEKQTESLQQAFEEISIQKEELKKTNAVKNKLFSLVAHDLRTPLNNMNAFVQLLKSDNFDQSKRDFILKDTTASLTDCMTVIDRLLHWSYSQLEGISAEKKDVEIAYVIDDVIKELKTLADNKNVTINKSFRTDTVYADCNMLRVVVRNLLSNAIKFSNEGSTILIASSQEGEKDFLSITDYGVGMNPEWYDLLMEKGQPEVKPGTKGEKGKGFGLLITKDFVEMNGGKLFCQSSEGKGTTFTIELPK